MVIVIKTEGKKECDSPDCFNGKTISFSRYLSRPFVTALSCSIFILPLCFFKRLDVLSYASSVGCITIVYVVWLIVYKSFNVQNGTVPPIKIWPDNGYEALQIIPIICFAYQVHKFLNRVIFRSNMKLFQIKQCINIIIITCSV